MTSMHSLFKPIEKPALKGRKRRKAVIDAQKQKLRAYFFNDSNGKPSYKRLAEWFEKKHNHRLASSTVSEILSARYEHLDVSGYNSVHKKK